MDLVTWSWLFLILYVAIMIAFGIWGRVRVKNADDFATARNAYGPVFLAFAFAATTASGATFVGFPGIAYEAGFTALWSVFLYPIGVYLGVLVCLRVVSNSGHEFGNRSIPEYLGSRYQSDAVRIMVSVFSLLLFFYLAGQLVSGIVMFELMLGVEPEWALGITAAVLMTYVVLGGAHADILTDGVQGFIMVVIGAALVVLFLIGFGVDGGLGGVVDNLRAQDPNLVAWLNPDNVLYHSWWSVLAVLMAHVPLGMLPHIGNKLWALKEPKQRRRFLRLAFTFGLTLGMLGLGGLLARAVLGDALLQPGETSNNALAYLFIELFPTWLAALLGIGILAAVMSTADGLVVSSSQIIANDLYRLSYIPRYGAHLDEETVDRRVLAISRLGTVAVMVICTAMAWALMDRNVAMIVWIGSGGMMAAFSGPLVVGAVWRGVTTAGAVAGLAGGVIVFVIAHSGVVDPLWFQPGWAADAAAWLEGEAPNPWSCATMGEVASVSLTWIVSKLTRPLPDEHIERMFGLQGGG
ncbi:MAG: sodium:solute symporter family protein [Pseudomonadales bacterium]|jgi:Na+/proline symporter|nr:sodium:solute symporter family protein [Pseudomonadales bacterium]MDP6470055.1 sodium:solute symporter family protein [Pseudomonadales bacterium]MDP6826958.1 sodium:solute symporter family protein [Pseudomonadales bacterium]MDP6971053.1 sodium:solute symporter family protein [Pseudomonadales bacterium]